MSDKDYIENPFSGYGRTVSDHNFIGREKHIATIRNRVTRPNDPNNLALIGYPRIGKSSLAEKALLKLENELLENKKVPIWISFGTLLDAKSFFRLLVMKAYVYFEDNRLADKRLANIYRNVQEETLSWTGLKIEVERFFEIATRMEFRFIFVLDEFDSARIIFKDNFAAFQELRELGYRGHFKVTYVTTSRRSIRDIEIQSGPNSVLDLILKKEYLSMYENAEIMEYYALYARTGLLLNEDQKQRIEYFCGGHPYLLAALGFEIVEAFKDGCEIDIDIIFKQIQLDFLDYYEQLIALLKEDGSFSKLLQILFGPNINVKPTDIEELSIYGLIRKAEKYYIAFSEHFQQYLKIKERDERIEIETWKLIANVEKRLRQIIHKTLTDSLGEGWFDKLSDKYDKQPDKQKWIKGFIQRLKDQQQEYVSQFGTIGKLNLIEYTYINELADIIKWQWNDYFEKILMVEPSKDLQFWQNALKSISKIRNPVYHQNIEAVPESEITKADESCNEIISITDRVLLK